MVADLYPAEAAEDAGGRIPPQDLAAEQSVLGAMLMSKQAIDPASELLSGRDFYRPAHELVFETIVDLANRGEPVDALTVKNELQRRGELARIGGAPYLHTLVNIVPNVASADYYASIVHEKAVLRRLIEVGNRISALGWAETGELESLVDTAQKEVMDVDSSRGVDDYRDVAALIGATIDEIEAIQARDGEMAGLGSGFDDLDRITTGFRPGQMIVVAARPGVGKSTLGLDFCRAASIRQSTPSAIFSLEMTGAEISMRLLSAEAKVPIHHMRGGGMSEDDWNRIGRAMPRVQSAPILIDDSPNLTMPEIRAKARRMHKQHGVGLIVIDYLQLMTSGKRVENRQVEVSEFSRQIKLLAKELEIPVVAISQLNRMSEQGGDKKPQLSNLRESGSIEQDADIVLLVHRPELYGDDERKGEADLIVAKNRSGPTDSGIAVGFQGHYSRFVPMAKQSTPPPPSGDFFG
ncbi:MAG TPA: replicative DNA helicase [Aeromicrobium sp.]|nr:replicative DNA helicase [Aeromicrobium sp.]